MLSDTRASASSGGQPHGALADAFDKRSWSARSGFIGAELARRIVNDSRLQLLSMEAMGVLMMLHARYVAQIDTPTSNVLASRIFHVPARSWRRVLAQLLETTPPLVQESGGNLIPDVIAPAVSKAMAKQRTDAARKAWAGATTPARSSSAGDTTTVALVKILPKQNKSDPVQITSATETKQSEYVIHDVVSSPSLAPVSAGKKADETVSGHGAAPEPNKPRAGGFPKQRPVTETTVMNVPVVPVVLDVALAYSTLVASQIAAASKNDRAAIGLKGSAQQMALNCIEAPPKALEVEAAPAKEKRIPKKEQKARLVVPYQEIAALYTEHCPTSPPLQPVNKWTDSRKEALRERVFQNPDLNWAAYFKRVHASDWLCGRDPDSAWKANFDWMIKASNFLKVIEGSYDHNTKSRKLFNQGGKVTGEMYKKTEIDPDEEFMRIAAERKLSRASKETN
jgi:hypothetical protein